MSRHVPVFLPRSAPSHALPQRAVARRELAQNVLAHAISQSRTVLEPGYNQDEVFDDQFERRAREIQRTPSGSNALSIVPQKTGPWTGLGQLGAERAFAPDANNRQTILKLDEWGFPERWTVSLGSVYDMVSGANEYNWSARAEITAGSGGAVQEFSVDWMEGTVFSVTANAILINAVFNEFEVNEEPENLRLRATICRGDSGTVTLPTRTELVSAAAGTSSTLVRIPPFTRYLSIINRITTAGGNMFDPLAEIQFQPTLDYTFAVGSFTGAQVLAMGNRIPIPALARAVGLKNGAAGDMLGKFIFNIQP